jgi:hypothetical protein
MESMSGRSTLSATKEQKSALAELACSQLRGEADRARAILPTLAGWTFAEGGVEALRSTLASEPSAEKGEQALAVASAVLRGSLENRTNWTLP